MHTELRDADSAQHADKLFTMPVRVYIEDTDAGGIVFYANYLKFFERARTEFFRARGIELRQCFAQNINYVVHSLAIRYKKPALLDDKLMISAQPVKIAKTYIVFAQQAVNIGGDVLVEAEVKIACLNFDTAKPRLLPEDLVASLLA
jgi:tol-pal system-associated acyl-CoA thioesterase